MREYTLVITANRSYYANSTYPERTWDLSIYGVSPFTMVRSYSKNEEYVEHNDFGFRTSKQKPQRLNITGQITFKGTSSKNAETLMQEFIAFSSIQDIDMPFLSYRFGVSYLDFQKDKLERFFQRKLLRSVNSDTGKTLFCYITAVALTNIQRYGPDIIATLNMTTSSLWLEEVSYSVPTASEVTKEYTIETEAPTIVSFQMLSSSGGIYAQWHQSKVLNSSQTTYFDRKQIQFNASFVGGFFGNVCGVDLAIKNTGATSIESAYSNFTFSSGYYTQCVVENGDVLEVTNEGVSENWSKFYYYKKYWSD